MYKTHFAVSLVVKEVITMGYEPTEYDHDPTKYRPNEPTIPALPHINPYDIGPYYQLPTTPPPPPPSPHRWTYALLAITVCVIIVAVVTVAVYSTTNHSITSTLQTSSVLVATPTDTTIPTSTATTSQPTTAIQPTTVTPSILYNAFVASSISATNPIQMDNSFWQCCSYYPGHGSIQFTEAADGNTLVIAVFNNSQDAELVATQQQWAAQYMQVDMCLLFSLEGPVLISYYKPIMQQYCV